MNDKSMYNKWWKQPEKNKVFGVTIHEAKKATDICDNKAFDQNEDKFARLEELLKVSLNIFEVTLLSGYDDNFKDKFDLFTSSQVYKPIVNVAALSLCIVNDIRGEGEITKFPSISCTSRI